MGRKKNSQKAKETILLTKNQPSSLDSFSAMAEELKLSESYKSLILGVAVVLLVAVLVLGYAKNRNAHNTQTTPKEVVAMQAEKKEEPLAMHTIAAGDDLKTISTKYYETPDLFLLVAKENTIQNPDAITEGEVLRIPKIDKKTFAPTLIPTASKDAITDTSYTVQEGDLLWNIAVRAYEDGNKWKDILATNNLQSPDAIFSGMILQLPR